ncbi:hypothetical protein [Sorangium sp. So ce117]|uniref:hypothetical protein n=1 Tax=Sorangium sp. So ce117 TaxID=3133277 RepID=UPI003F637155
MSQLAAGAMIASYLAYVQPEGGAGRESAIVVRKWRECVVPHYTEPMSRQIQSSSDVIDIADVDDRVDPSYWETVAGYIRAMPQLPPESQMEDPEPFV